MTVIKAVSFDLAGTLISPHPSVGKIYAQCAQKHGVEVSAADLDRQFLLALKGTPRQSSPQDFWREVVLRTFGEKIPTTKFAAIYQACWQAFADERAWRLAPGALSTLAALRFLGIHVVVLSNSDQRMYSVLKGKKIDQLFAGIFLADETQIAKPSPLAFQQIAQKLQIPISTLVHVGNDPREDGMGAQAAGARSIIIGGAHAPEPCLRAETIGEVPFMIRALLTEGKAKGKFSRQVTNLLANLRGLPEDTSRSSQRALKTIDEAVQDAFKKIRIHEPVPEDAIFAHWAQLLPPKLAKRCAPLRVVQDQKLIIQCENSVVKSEVRFHEKSLLAKIRSLRGCAKIQALTFVTA